MEVRTRRERYGAAASNGNLRQRDDRPTDADTIAAAGMAGETTFYAEEAGRTVGTPGTLPAADRVHVFTEEEFDDMRARQ
jgi:hypothetical protein